MSTIEKISNFDVNKDVDTVIAAVNTREKENLLNILCFRTIEQRLVSINELIFK